MRSIIVVLAALALATSAYALGGGTHPSGPGGAAAHCTKGIACGDTCIAAGKVCHVTPPKACKTGIPCGNTCIAKGKVCHV